MTKSNPMQEPLAEFYRSLRVPSSPKPEFVIASALHTADVFISDELEVRRRSYEPNPTPQEIEDIAAAIDALALVRAASQQVTNL